MESVATPGAVFGAGCAVLRLCLAEHRAGAGASHALIFYDILSNGSESDGLSPSIISVFPFEISIPIFWRRIWIKPFLLAPHENPLLVAPQGGLLGGMQDDPEGLKTVRTWSPTS